VTGVAAKSGAERMREVRRRRRDGYRCVTVEVHESELDWLVSRGLLPADRRDDMPAVIDALHGHLEASMRDQ